MSQVANFVIENDTGAAVRAQINQVLAALQSTHAGATPPLGTAPGMVWVDTSTTPSPLYIRDPTDSAFEALLDGGQF